MDFEILLEKSAKKNTADVVYEQILRSILLSRYEPGEKLSEVMISDQLSVSRTPVREALIRLSQEELVYVVPKSGSFVAKIDFKKVEEGRLVRLTLEKKVSDIAAIKCAPQYLKECQNIIELHKKAKAGSSLEQFQYDELFHRTLYIAAGMMRTWGFIEKMNMDFIRVRYLALTEDISSDHIIFDHQSILNAIENHDGNAAVRHSAEHLLRWDMKKMVLFQRFPHYFTDPPPIESV